MKNKHIYSNLTYRIMFYVNKVLSRPSPRKILFDHIPKCGGVTVWNYIISQYAYRKMFNINGRCPSESIDYFMSLPEEDRFAYDFVSGHGADLLREYVHPESLKVTILRNPIERVISHYFYVVRDLDHYLNKSIRHNKVGLSDYVTSEKILEVRNHYVSHYLRMSSKEAEKEPEVSVRRAFDLIQKEFSVVGILEDLDTAMDELRGKAGFFRKFESKRLNATQKRPGSKEIDSAILEKIAEVNCLDIKLYELVKNLLKSEKVNRNV